MRIQRIVLLELHSTESRTRELLAESLFVCRTFLLGRTRTLEFSKLARKPAAQTQRNCQDIDIRRRFQKKKKPETVPLGFRFHPWTRVTLFDLLTRWYHGAASLQLLCNRLRSWITYCAVLP